MLRARLLGALEVELERDRDPRIAVAAPLGGVRVPRARPLARSRGRSWRAASGPTCWIRARARACAARCGRCAASSGTRSWSTATGSGSTTLEGVWVDVHEFDRLADTDPEAALELCRGELLEGLEDEWALSARERHRERVIAVLERLAQAAEQRDELREAVELTRRQVERDPFDEGAHRRLITRLDASGDRAAAMRSYRTLTERLRRELGVAPSSQTRELVEQLRLQTPAAPADRGGRHRFPGCCRCSAAIASWPSSSARGTPSRQAQERPR